MAALRLPQIDPYQAWEEEEEDEVVEEEVEVVVHYRHSHELTPHPNSSMESDIVSAAYSCPYNEMPHKQHYARKVKCITISM
jgi:hypothetical protein